MAKTWPFYGQNIVHQIRSCCFLIIVSRDVPSQISHCWVYPVAPFLKMVKTCPFYGQNMVLEFGSSWILIIVARDVPCQISHCWVYPVAPIPRNGQNIALLCPIHGLYMVRPFMAKTCSWIFIIVPRNVPCKISHCWVYPVVPFLKNSQNFTFYGQNMVLTWSF